MPDIENWGGDEIFKNSPEFLGNPSPEARHLVSSGGKKFQFLASLSSAASIASDASEHPRDAYDIYNDLYTELSMRNARFPTGSAAASESKRLVELIGELLGVGALRSLSGIAITSYLEDLKLAHRVAVTTEALEEGAAIVLPFAHHLAPGGMQMKKRVPAWGVLTSYPNIPIAEDTPLDRTSTASVIFPTFDSAIKISMLPDDLISVIAADNRGVSDGNTGFLVRAR